MTQFWDISNNLELQEWESLRATMDWFEAFTPADESDIPDISSKANLSWWNTFNWNQTIEWWLKIDTTTDAIIVPRMTTTQRNALTWVNWMLIYNTTTNQFNFHDTSWKAVVLATWNQTIDWNKTFLQNIRITKWDTETKWYEWNDWVTTYWFYRNWDEHLNLMIGTQNHWFRSNWQVWIWGFPSDRLTVFWNIIPWTDNANSLGTTSNRFSSVWAANWVIQTSDQRDKTEVKKSILWLDFIKKLNPVSFKWIVGGNEVSYIEREVEVEEQEMEEREVNVEKIEIIDWKAVVKIEVKKEYIPVFDEIEMFLEDWTQVFDFIEKRVTEQDEDWNEIEVIKKEAIPRKYQIPRMIKKIITEKKEIITEKLGNRNHFWFLAQEVEEALWWVDFWGLVIDENDKYALRFDQFISPIIKAIQEMTINYDLEIQSLKERIQILENKQ